MHELSITEGIIKIVESEAKKHHFNKVNSIKLVVGELSGVFPQLIQEYFNIASRGTIAEGAELIIRRVEARMKCNECGNESIIERHRLRCKNCGSLNVRITAGKEFYVDSLEVD
ncbi:hydrogenase maturation nickel metallochaperone HypA [Thermobrachium celere]|uniref:Hydrogenase maturation factor HypA n=2 Tax=Thermobrachium TaxID=150333 RepID=R7RS89_9CLOT|nr:hydrogenase maturation nickel metallochaperone HypA [Thermobrachium celere]CDF58153.1 [NiFe] hydrogenase nickel incorporation protein HypA [Thermobrachium celere DSM 8682]